MRNLIILTLAVVLASVCAARTVRQTFGIQDADNSITIQKSGLTTSTDGDHEQSAVFSVATNETTLAISSDIKAGNGPGLALLFNEDSTNACRVGLVSGTFMLNIPGGRGGVMWLDSAVTQLVFKASNTSILFRVHIFER